MRQLLIVVRCAQKGYVARCGDSPEFNADSIDKSIALLFKSDWMFRQLMTLGCQLTFDVPR